MILFVDPPGKKIVVAYYISLHLRISLLQNEIIDNPRTLNRTLKIKPLSIIDSLGSVYTVYIRKRYTMVTLHFMKRC